MYFFYLKNNNFISPKVELKLNLAPNIYMIFLNLIFWPLGTRMICPDSARISTNRNVDTSVVYWAPIINKQVVKRTLEKRGQQRRVDRINYLLIKCQSSFGRWKENVYVLFVARVTLRAITLVRRRHRSNIFFCLEYVRMPFFVLFIRVVHEHFFFL